MVTVMTVVPVLFRSLTRSSRVVLGWPLTFRRVIDTPRGEILHWSPSPREIDSHLEFLPFSNNCANIGCFLTKLFAYCPVAHPSLVQVYNFVPSVLRQLFGLAHSGEFESDWFSVWTGVFYTSNEFKQVQLIQVMSGG